MLWSCLLHCVCQCVQVNIAQQLADKIQKSKVAGRRPVVVFDLDATLFENAPRTWKILWEYASTRGERSLLDKLSVVVPVNWPYALSDVLGFLEHPHLMTEELLAFWKERFFKSEYQLFDVAMPGALELATYCYQEGCFIVYLTGRDVPGMLQGCVDSLVQTGFPLGGVRTQTLLKTTFEMPDELFKQEAIEAINELGQVVLSIDNEPANCNLFQNAWPSAVIAHIESHCAPNPPPLVDGILCIEGLGVFSELTE